MTDPINKLFNELSGEFAFFLHGLNETQVAEKKRRWAYNLRHVPPDQVDKAMKTCLREFGEKSGPTLSQFLSYCKRMEPVSPSPQADLTDTEYERTRRKAAGLYAKKICGIEISGALQAAPANDFPMAALIRECPTPKKKGVTHDRQAWQTFYELFDALWEQDRNV